ncbi:MAG: SprB repeat-containing protein [Bacteroidetes bacterium]|nr:SprB repeat-containing protein [Bacteroidota bacterium]
MKKYKIYLKKIVLLFLATALSIFTVTAQDHESKDNYTGNWEDAGTWTVGDGNISNGDIINIYGQVNRNSDIFIDNLAELNVFDTLIIYGNLSVGNNGILNIKTGAILIVYGNALMNNRVEVDLDSYFVVFGDYDQENNSEIDAPVNDTLLYVSGGTSCGNGATCVDGDLVGDEDDMYDNPDIDEIIEATSNFITPRSPTLCSGGSLVLSIRDDGVNYEWFKTSDPTTILSTESTLTITATGTYDVDFEIGGVPQSVDPVTVTSSGTVSFSVSAVVTNASGVGLSDGEIDLTVTPSGTYTYDWSNGERTEDLSGLAAGDYIVEVEDDNCRVTETFSVTDVACTDPDLSTVTTPEICNGSSYDISNIVVVDANATNPTYTYHSASPALPGNELPSTTVSPAATTTYYILGTNGSCTDELPVEVIVNSLPTVTDQTPEAICSEAEAEMVQITGLDLTANEAAINGGAGMSYAWYNDLGLTSDIGTPTAVDINDVFGGATTYNITYYCKVTNANNCSDVASVTYTIYRIPETGPQYHLDNSWGN